MKSIMWFFIFIAFIFSPFIWGYRDAKQTCSGVQDAPRHTPQQSQVVIG